MMLSSKSLLVFLAAAAALTVNDVASFSCSHPRRSRPTLMMMSSSSKSTLFMSSSMESEPFAVGGEVPAFATVGDVSLNPPSIGVPTPPSQQATLARPPPASSAVSATLVETPAPPTTTTKVSWMPDGGIPMYVERDRLMQKRQVIIDTVATAKGEEESSKIKLFESDGGMMLQQSSFIKRRFVRNELPDLPKEEQWSNKIPLFESDGGMMLQQSSLIQSLSQLVYADAPNMVEDKAKAFTTFKLESNDMMYVSKYQLVPKEQIRYETVEMTKLARQVVESAPVTIDIPLRTVRPRLMLTPKVVAECETRGQVSRRRVESETYVLSSF